MVIRKSVKTRKLFPSDDAALKVVYLAITAAPKKWTMPIHNWKPALNRFISVYPDTGGELAFMMEQNQCSPSAEYAIIENEEQIAPHI